MNLDTMRFIVGEITSFSPEIEFLPILVLLPVRDNKFIDEQ